MQGLIFGEAYKFDFKVVNISVYAKMKANSQDK